MKRFLTALALSLACAVSFGATLSPIQLLNPAGSTAGQAILSTGASSAPAWGNVSISTLTGVLPVANGGTNANAASGTALDNITGFSSTGFLTRTGAGTYAFQSTTNGITLANLVQGAANTVLANATGSTANFAAFSMPSCSAGGSALLWTSGTGFGCATGYATLASPTFTGTPAAPTATAGTNTTQLATTAYVQTALTGGGNAGSFTTLNASSNDAMLYQNSSGQSIPSGTNTTVTTWTKVYDRVNANFNASTGVFTAPVTGYYLVSAHLTFASAAGVAGTVVNVSVNVNGTIVATGQTAVNNTGTSTMSAQVSAIVLATSGQTIVIQAGQTSGSARALGGAVTDFMSISRMP